MRLQYIIGTLLMSVIIGVSSSKTSGASGCEQARSLTETEIARLVKGRPSAQLSVAGKELLLVGSGRIFALEGNRLMMAIDAPQYHGGIVQSLTVLGPYAVFVDGASNDWLIRLDVSGTGCVRGSLAAVPLLYTKRCSFLGRFVDTCPFAQWVYDSSESILSVTGYRGFFAGPETIQIYPD